MHNRIRVFIGMAAGLALSGAVAAYAAEKPESPKVTPPPYERSEALTTIMNPHEQINDEGEILWGTCLICHQNVPDIQKDKSIKDVKLRFEEDPNQLCRQCHTVRVHPGTEGISATMSGYVAPDHLVVPPKHIMMSLRLAKKEIPMILPLDPKSGKIICSTCHNPHERGLLVGRADWGGDYSMRLRSAGLDICQYCHRK
ncbi:MAG: hypothetical protein HY956_11195 [Deltaproteobacteria bacterium]|nr:hypothetical protein [Deltaproteobacteria bacterium]